MYQDFDQAAYWWRKAAEQGHIKAVGNYGTLFLSGRGVTKSFQTAEEWIARSAKAGNPSAYNNMASLRMMHGQLEKALKYSKIAVKKAPKDANFWSTLATILAKLGGKHAAFKVWDKALELSRGNKGILQTARKYGYKS